MARPVLPRPIENEGPTGLLGTTTPVRLRRDFGQLLELIRAQAILHPARRVQDPQGSIVATLDDWAVLRDLVVAATADGVVAAVSSTVRGTVSAVQGLLGEGRTEATVRETAWNHMACNGLICRERLEARAGIEPTWTDLQSAA